MPKSAHVLAYHYIVVGRPLLQIAGQPPLRLQAGQLVLLPRNDAHTLSSAPGLAGIDAGPLIAPPNGGGLAQIRFGGGGKPTQIVCGCIGCESGRHPLIDALPAVLTLNVREWAAGAWIETLFLPVTLGICGAIHLGGRSDAASLSRDWRMQLAKRALRQGMAVVQIAGRVGYDSEAAFSRAFKREVGCAPTVWRQQG